MYACIHAPNFPALAACCHDFSPRVEEVAPGTMLLEIGGLDRLYGSPEQIAGAIARRVSPQANIAVARSPDAAIHAARGLAGVTVIPAGEECRFLGDLPIQLLSPPPEIEETLSLWGIRTFRDLTALPEDGVAERLGPEGVRLQQSARGVGQAPGLPSEPAPPVLEETMELDYPLTLIEPLSFILAQHLHTICVALEARSLATNEIRLRLKLEDKTEHARTYRLPYPMHDRAALLKLIQLDLDGNPPCAPVVAVSLAADPVPPRVIQHGLFVPAAPEPQKLELTLARIARLVGDQNVGSPELLDTHRPDAFRLMRFAPVGQVPDLPSGLAGRGPAPLAARIFRPPLQAQVKTASGQPKQIFAPNVRGEVVRAAGPWRSSGEWWRPGAWSRDEWDVAIASGAVYRIYFDRRTNGWFVEGNYD